MVCAFYYFFIFVRPLAQLEVKPRVAFYFGGQNNDFTISGDQNPEKPPKIGTNRHFQTKMLQSYNSNISETINRIKSKL